MQNFNNSTIFNILLIGKNDGYLKALSLNALPNYLKFNRFEDADTLIELVPVNVNFYDRNKCENILIPFGESLPNEEGTLRCYLLSHCNSVVRIIETPEQESTPSQTIAAVHKICGTLHGILYLFTSEQIQENIDFFKNKCIPLLTEMGEISMQNVAFCFTLNHHPNYDIKELKQIIDNEFNFQLKNGNNCFHIDCEPFQLMLARKSRLYEITENDKFFWTKSNENVCTILNKIATNKPMFNVEEYFIVKDSKDFFSFVEKSVTELEMIIIEKEEELESEAKWLKTFKNENLNNDCYMNILTEMNGKPDDIKDCLEELNTLKQCTRKFIQFIFSILNQNAKGLISPFILEFLSMNKNENKQIKTQLTQQNSGEDVSDTTLENFIDSINKNIKLEEIINFIAKLISLNILGKNFNKHFAYFQTKLFINPSLKQILDLVWRVVAQIVNHEVCLDVYRKSISEMENADQSKIRIICFKSTLNQKKSHEECECKEKDIVLNVIGHPSVQRCKTIEVDSEKCTKCKFSWNEHFHKTTKDFQVYLKNEIEILQDECNVIQNVASKFDYLLMKHSQVCLNDYMDQYLSNHSKDSLNKLKNEHWQNVLKLIESNEKVELTDIPELCEQLFQLKRSGNDFKSVKQGANMTNANAMSGIVQQKQSCSTSSNSENTQNI